MNRRWGFNAQSQVIPAVTPVRLIGATSVWRWVVLRNTDAADEAFLGPTAASLATTGYVLAATGVVALPIPPGHDLWVRAAAVVDNVSWLEVEVPEAMVGYLSAMAGMG